MAGEMIHVNTRSKRDVIDLTDRIQDRIGARGFSEGICLLTLQHTTAALTVGEVGEGTEEDLLEVLHEMIPKIRFRHAHNPAHAPAHMVGSILGPSLALPVDRGRLVLGTWQSVLLIELDGPRQRSLHLLWLGAMATRA